MSCSFDKILSDVKNLTQRLKFTDETTNKIIKDTSYFYVNLKSMNELQEKISSLSQHCQRSDGGDLSFHGKMENANLEKLRMENIELCELLKEYQTALELIMSRYRADMNAFMTSGSIDAAFNRAVAPDFEALHSLELDLTAKCAELYKIAIEASSSAEAHMQRLEKSIETLHGENEAMRDVLGLIDFHYHHHSDDVSAPLLQPPALCGRDERKSSDHLFDSSFSDDDRCSVSSDASVKTLM